MGFSDEGVRCYVEQRHTTGRHARLLTDNGSMRPYRFSMFWAIWLGLVCGYFLTRDAFRHFIIAKEGGAPEAIQRASCPDLILTDCSEQAAWDYRHWLQASDVWPVLLWGILLGVTTQAVIVLAIRQRGKAGDRTRRVITGPPGDPWPSRPSHNQYHRQGRVSVHCMTLLIGYVKVTEIPQRGIQADASGSQPPVSAGTGLVHAYLEDDADETLCGERIVDATHRSFPDTHSGEEVCAQCLELSDGLQ
jgi:hypothetical protein